MQIYLWGYGSCRKCIDLAKALDEAYVKYLHLFLKLSVSKGACFCFFFVFPTNAFDNVSILK